MAANDRIVLDQVTAQKKAELAPDLNESEFFDLFVAEQTLKDHDLSYDELESGIVDEGGDGGIDAIYIFVNGELVQEDTDLATLKRNVELELVIIQSKRSPGFSEAALDRLTAVSEDMLDLSKDVSSFSGVYNDGVRQCIDLFRRTFTELAGRFPEVKFRYCYASRGDEVHPNVRRKAGVLQEKVKTLFSAAEVQVEFLGAAELLALARRAPKTSFTLNLAETPISSAGEVAFICLVKLQDYYAFITDDHHNLRRAMFEANVRDYQKGTEVNLEIQESLQEPGQEDFWWLNNGITIVATRATQSGKALTIEDPQVVNGLQTSTEIRNYFSEAGMKEDSRNLLVRVIVPSKPESRDRIIKATNSQTYIPPASLRATDKIHRDIEDHLKQHGVFYDRRKNFWKNEGKKIDQIVGIPFVAQAVVAIARQRPDNARGRPSSLLKKDEDYKTLFDSAFPLDLYLVCVELVRRVEMRMRLEGVGPRDRNNIRFHVAMVVASRIAGKRVPSLDDISRLDLAQLTDSRIDETTREVMSVYQRLGGDDKIAKAAAFVEAVKTELLPA